MRGEGDRHAGVELFEFADLVAGLDGAAGQPGPCGGVPGGGELGHAGAQFGDDDLGVGGADAGDLIEPLDDRQHPGLVAGAGGGVAAADQPAAGADSSNAGDLFQQPGDLPVQPGDLGGQVIDELQQHAGLNGVDVAEPAGEGGLQLGRGG